MKIQYVPSDGLISKIVIGKLELAFCPAFKREFKYRVNPYTHTKTLNLFGVVLLVWRSLGIIRPLIQPDLTLRAQARLGVARQHGAGVRVLANGDLQIALSETDRHYLLIDAYIDNPMFVCDLALASGDSAFCAEVDEIKAYLKGYNSYSLNHPRSLGHIEMEFLSAYEENGVLAQIKPEDIAALTDAPIVGLNTSIDDNGDLELFDDSLIFWYPDYAIRSFIEDLLVSGETIFTHAGD